ncbi:MAG: epoxyqueuosine reductase [Promethearchaeota archaeon]|nr:MAG: epoxyqueuosine reductase [Candidatus Lokiarchaeota archaeon]
MDKAELRELILSEGIDLVGFTDARDHLLSYPPRPATKLMSTAKSIIIMAVAHSLGSVYAPDIKIWTRNKMQTSRLLDQVAEKVGRLLEREGFLSMPISADKPVEIHKIDPKTGKKFNRTKVVSHLSLKHAAVSAGMGQIGKSNLLLTEEFGPHQRLGGIITEAEFQPDPFKELNLCIEGCKKCENACPVGALKDGEFDVDKCFTYWALGFKKQLPGKIREFPSFLKMLWRHNKYRDWFTEFGQNFITDVDYCIECMKACPVGSHWKKIRPKSR